MTDDPVRVAVEGGVATLTLNRPGNYNALTTEMSAGIIDAVERHWGPFDIDLGPDREALLTHLQAVDDPTVSRCRASPVAEF